MKKQILIALAAVMTLGLGSAYAQNDCCKSVPYVEVRGAASTTVEPNKIEVYINLNEADSKGKVTLKELESGLASALKKAGIDATKQLVVTSQSSTAAKRNDAYQYKSFQLTLTSQQELSSVFEAFEEFGVANANVGRVWNDKQSQIEMEVKTAAVLNAQKSANILAAGLGQTIGRAIMIQDYSSSPEIMDGNVMFARAAYSKASASLPDDLQMRKITITQSVTVRFLLQ